MKRHLSSFTAMGCPCAVHLYLPDDLDRNAIAENLLACRQEAVRFERKYSRYRDDSVVSRINAAAGGSPVPIDEESGAILDYAHACWEASEGEFDITAGVMRQVWHQDMYRVPNACEVRAALDLVGWQRVERSTGSVRLPVAGMEIDFGGVVKEYAADAIAALARNQGVMHGLVDLGGDLKIIGPHPDGSPWEIGIAHPWEPGTAIARTRCWEGAVTTSGNYERAFEVDGRRFSHLINPRTGWPVSGLTAASVMAESAVVAGSLSSMAMLKPEADALDWLAELGLPYVAVCSDRRVQLAGAAELVEV